MIASTAARSTSRIDGHLDRGRTWPQSQREATRRLGNAASRSLAKRRRIQSSGAPSPLVEHMCMHICMWLLGPLVAWCDPALADCSMLAQPQRNSHDTHSRLRLSDRARAVRCAECTGASRTGLEVIREHEGRGGGCYVRCCERKVSSKRIDLRRLEHRASRLTEQGCANNPARPISVCSGHHVLRHVTILVIRAVKR